MTRIRSNPGAPPVTPPSSCTLSKSTTRRCLSAAIVALCLLPRAVQASWGDGSDDTSIYGAKLSRDWLYEASAMSIRLEGCMYGYVEDNEEAGCMENESEDGTIYWYMMANCRRAQAVYSVYASSSSSAGCNNGNFKESFVTTTGASEFFYYLRKYDQNGHFNNDDQYGDDNNYDGEDDLPACEQANGYYIGLGCADDGSFSLQYFDDQYCMQPSGVTYDKLSNLNKALKNYKNCASIGSGSGSYSNGGGGGDGNNNYFNNLAEALVYNSDSCSSLDSSYCTDSEAMDNRRKHSASRMHRNRGFGAGKTWLTKLKYVAGGLLLLASFVMFTGILFTNRRRRRALMQRKYRQRKGEERSRRSKSRSKSKMRSSSSRGKSRSKSKSRSSSAKHRESSSRNVGNASDYHSGSERNLSGDEQQQQNGVFT